MEDRVAELARHAADRFLPGKFDRVVAKETLDSTGEDALSVTIVLKPKVARKLNGDRVLDTLVAIQNALRLAGEDRLAIVHYEEAGQEEEPDPDAEAA